MSQISIEAAKQQLGQIAKSYQRPLRGKFAILAPLRDEIVELAGKGAASAEIAAFLAQCQIAVSKDTVARFVRMETAKERSSRAKKAGPAIATSASSAASPRSMLPRGLSIGND